MSDTLGDLIDKLSIANIRLWHVEDERRDYVNKQRATPSYTDRKEDNSFVIMETEPDPKAIRLLDMVAKVNKERNSLIDQINAGLAVLIDKARNKDSTFELTADELLGTGKNKFYKMEDRA